MGNEKLMADNDNLGNIQESFEYITEALDSIRAQNAMNSGISDKILTSINTQLETLTNEENSDLVKVFLAELKKSLEERHNFVSSKFSEIENSFRALIEKSENQLQASEIKEVFEIIATNLNVFSKDFSSQKEVISEIGLKIEELQQDDSQKKEILKNISTLKVELEKFGNGFESIILNLNDNFKEVSQFLTKLDSSESLSGLKKDIENVFLSSNAILSTLQVIDRKNRELEEVITHVVTKEDFNLEREQVAKLIVQNLQLTEYISTLPTQGNLESLTEKIDTSVGVINALKNMITDTGKQNQQLLTAQLDNLESKILNISTEEEFIGFRKELSEFAQEVIQSTNLMRSDLADTNSGLKELLAYLSAMDIKNTFADFSKLNKVSETNITENIYKLSTNVSEEIGKNRKLTKVDIEDGVSEVNEKIELTKQEITETSKLNLTSILEHIQSVINNVFSVKNALHIENLENAEAIDNKLEDLKENLTASNNFIVQNSQENLENILENVEKVFGEIVDVKENLIETSSQNFKNLGGGFNEISKKIGEIKNELSQNSQESFANLLSIVEDFSQEISVLKTSLEETSQENSGEIKGVIESLSEKLNALQDVLTKNSELNSSELKSSIEQLTKTTQSIRSSLEQASSIGFSGLKSNLEELSEELKTIEENFDIKSQTNLSKIVVLFEDLSKEFNIHKAFLSESTQVNFETVSLYLQNLTRKIDETKNDFNEDLKSNFSELQNSISALPETIKENQSIFENEKRTLIEENSKNIEEVGNKVQNLIKGFVAKENPFKGEVLYEFEQLKSNIEMIKEDLSQSNQVLGENIEAQITANLQNLEESISQYNETYNSALFGLQNKLVEYFELIQQTTQESDLKLDNSIKEASEIKTEVKSIIESLSELKEDSTLTNSLADLSINMSKKFEGILLNITQLEGISSTKNKDAVQNVLSTLEEKFEGVSTDLKTYQSLTTEEMGNFVEELSDKVETIKSQISLANTDLLDALATNTNELASLLSPIKDSINKITSINFDELALGIKNKIDSSYFSITSVIKENTKQENAEQLEKLSQDFENLNEKLDEIIAKASSDETDKAAEKLEELKNILDELAGKIEDNEFLIEQFATVKDSIFDVKSQGTQNANSINDALKTVLEKLEEPDFSEALIEKINVLEDNLLLSQDETKTMILDGVLQSQGEMQTALLEELKEDYKISTKEIISESIDKTTEESREKVFEKLEELQDKLLEVQKNTKTEILGGITQAQEQTETSILNELQENIAFIKEILSSVSPDEKLSENLSQEIEQIVEKMAEQLEVKISDSTETYKTSTQSLLSDVKTTFYEKVDDSLDDLRSFIEILEDKRDFSVALDDLKSDVFDKFSEFSDNLEASINSISVKKDLKELSNEVEASINSLFENLEEKFLSSIGSSEVIAGLGEKSEEINRRIEDLKKVITEDITEKLDGFELTFETQNKDFSALIENLKTSLEELKENYVDLSLNSTMEMSSLLIDVQEKVDKLGNKFDNLDFSDVAETVGKKFDGFDFNKAIENSRNEIEEVITGNLTKEFEIINQKLDVFSLDSDEEIKEEITESLTKEFEAINKKLDAFSFDSDAEMEADIKEIKQIVQSQSQIVKQLDKLASTDEIHSIKNAIQSTLQKFEEKLNSLSLKTPNKETPQGDIKNDLSSFKEELLANILDIFNQISFVEESEDIKDFVADQANEVKESLKSSLGNNFGDILSSLDVLHKKTGDVDYKYVNLLNEIRDVKNRLLLAENEIEGESDYSYTLQDVESDIAKLRLILNDLATGKSGNAPEPLGDFEKLNEAVMSISTRTNKILLTSDESNNALKSNLDELRNVVYQFEEKVNHLDGKETIGRVEKKLENVNNLMLSSVKSDKIFNQTFMYLAEWVDTASENLESIIEKVSDIDGIKISVADLKKSMPKRSDIETILDEVSEKFNRQQEKIDSLEDKLEKVLTHLLDGGMKPDNKLSKKVDNIDKQLTKLSKGIEKLASYVDEG